jgi:hypothetical protein
MVSSNAGSVVIASIGVATSLVVTITTTIAIVSYRFGTLKAEVSELQSRIANMVTTSDLAPIKETLAEIKGMFRLELKDK